jgi:hypothetical protein
MYFAYYTLRSDGDGDLFAVVEDGECTDKELSLRLQKTIEQALNGVNKWFLVERMDCDFPGVWDLTSIFPDRKFADVSKNISTISNDDVLRGRFRGKGKTL